MTDTIESRNIRTMARLKDMWENNIVENKPLIKNDISLLWNDFCYVEGILVAAGPSLKDSIVEIKERQRSSIYTEVVAVDMAAKYLIDNGVKPDFVICCEAKAEAAKMFNYECDVPLVCDVVTNPEIVKKWKGDKFFFIMNNPSIDLDNNNQSFMERHKSLSGVDTSLVVGGNVGSAGLSFLLSVRNCKKVHLYGHEFSWKKDGDFYCGGIHKDMAEKRIATEKQCNTLYERKDVKGNDVYTNLSLLTFLDWYRNAMKMFPNVIVNHTKAGLLF
ncbi:MAG: hypothetical protein RLY43_996 [Bacteroidota bacterium]